MRAFRLHFLGPALGEDLSFLAERNRADRIHACGLRALRLSDDEPDRCLIVGDRIGVGHRANCREATSSSCLRSGCNRLHVLASRLAQVAVDVDESGRDDEPITVDHLGVLGRVDPVTTGGDHTIRHQQITHSVQTLRRIDERAPAQKERLHSLSLRRRLLPPFAASASSGLPPARR